MRNAMTSIARSLLLFAAVALFVATGGCPPHDDCKESGQAAVAAKCQESSFQCGKVTILALSGYVECSCGACPGTQVCMNNQCADDCSRDPAAVAIACSHR